MKLIRFTAAVRQNLFLAWSSGARLSHLPCCKTPRGSLAPSGRQPRLPFVAATKSWK